MKYIFNVPDMSCNHCRMRIEKAMNESGRVKGVTVDLQSKRVTLESDLTEAEIVKIFDKAGYDAERAE